MQTESRRGDLLSDVCEDQEQLHLRKVDSQALTNTHAEGDQIAGLQVTTSMRLPAKIMQDSHLVGFSVVEEAFWIELIGLRPRIAPLKQSPSTTTTTLQQAYVQSPYIGLQTATQPNHNTALVPFGMKYSCPL